MKIEIRADKSVVIEGYVNAVGRDSRELPSPKGKFVEQVEPKTFQRAIEKADLIELKHNHNRVIGNNNESLELHEDSIGLFARAITNDEVIYQRAKNKQLKGWSFGFEKIADEWEETRAGLPRRILKDINLTEVSIIDSDMTPCYVGTSIEARGETDFISETRAEEKEFETVDNERAEEKPNEETQDFSIEEKELELLSL